MILGLPEELLLEFPVDADVEDDLELVEAMVRIGGGGGVGGGG